MLSKNFVRKIKISKISNFRLKIQKFKISSNKSKFHSKLTQICIFSPKISIDFDLGLSPLDVATYEHFRAPTGLAQHTVAMNDDAQFQSHKSDKNLKTWCRFKIFDFEIRNLQFYKTMLRLMPSKYVFVIKFDQICHLNYNRTWFSKGKNRIDVGKTKICSKFWTLISKFRV